MANKTMLTPKQEKFAQCVAKGMSQSDAYRNSFNVREKTKMETINQAASRLMADNNISARVEELRAPIVANVRLTLESHLAELDRLAKLAEALDNPSAAIKAQELRGKAAGLYVDRSESKVEGSLVVEIVKF